MEILQTIWNALTSENQVVLLIISIPMLFLELTLTLLLFTQILHISFSKKDGLKCIIGNLLLALLASYLIPAPFNTFINITAFPVIVYFTLKTNALKAILSEITFYITILCVGTPLVTILTAVFNFPSTLLMSVPIYKLIYSFALYLLLYILYKLLKKFNIHIKIFDKFDHSSNNILIINFIIGTVAIALQGYIEFIYIDYLPLSLILTSIIVLILYFCISFYSLIRTSQLERTKQLLEQEKVYNKTLNTLHDNIRGFKHDFNNIIQAVGGYLSTNNIDGLRTYYKDLLEECQINNNLAVLNPEVINNPAIYSLLADKYYKSEKLGIKMNLEVMTDLSNLNIKTYELTRILGVLFDNAIEAAAECDIKAVNITFRRDIARNKNLIIIQNTYVNKEINIDRIFEKGYTSKQDNKKDKEHGLGLWEVRKYVKKHPNLDLYTTKTYELFTQQFEIYN